MLVLLVQLAFAQPGNPYLEKARELARDLRFADAISELEIAKQVPGLDVQQRREVVELLARCQVAEGRRAAGPLPTRDMLLRGGGRAGGKSQSWSPRTPVAA